MLLAPTLYGMEHLVFLAVYLVITVTSLTLAKLFIKTEKGQWIFVRVIAVIVLIFDILTRIGIIIHGASWINLVPNSFCAMTGFVFPIIVLFGKKDLYCYHGLWYLALVGGLATILYPDFIGQGETIWYLNTICGLIYHGGMFTLAIAMGMFKFFRPSIKKSFGFPLTMAAYIIAGTFIIHKLGMGHAMCIDKPLLSGTPLDCWFILVGGTALVYLAAFIYEYSVKLIEKKKAAKIEAK